MRSLITVFAFAALSAASIPSLACDASPPAASAPAPTAATTAPIGCSGQGTLSIRADGDGLAAHEGKRVWLSAVERDHGGVVGIAEGRVRQGRVSLSCAKSLHTTYGYPTFAVVIDADGDGKCSANDLAASQQLYGWNQDTSVRFDLRARPGDPLALRFGRVAEARGGINSEERAGFDFCALYFSRARK